MTIRTWILALFGVSYHDWVHSWGFSGLWVCAFPYHFKNTAPYLVNTFLARFVSTLPFATSQRRDSAGGQTSSTETSLRVLLGFLNKHRRKIPSEIVHRELLLMTRGAFRAMHPIRKTAQRNPWDGAKSKNEQRLPYHPNWNTRQVISKWEILGNSQRWVVQHPWRKIPSSSSQAKGHYRRNAHDKFLAHAELSTRSDTSSNNFNFLFRDTLWEDNLFRFPKAIHVFL